MDTTPLYDLSPALRVMAMGLLLAVGPLLWVRLRSQGAPAARRLLALTVLTLFLTFDLVLFGAFTRLTDSGLGCPDWPGCYGKGSPVGAREHIAAAQQAMPTGPVTHGKAWVEMIHRYLATAVGVLIIALAVATWVEWRRARAAGAQPGTAPRGGVLATGTDATAWFTNTLTGARVVTNDFAGQRIGHLRFAGGAGAWTLAGGSISLSQKSSISNDRSPRRDWQRVLKYFWSSVLERSAC